MALKLFKRRNKNKQKNGDSDQSLEKDNNNPDNNNNNNTDQIISNSGSGSTVEQSISMERDEGLFTNNSKENYNGNIQVVSAKEGADLFKASDVRDSMLRDQKGFKAKRTTFVPTAKNSAYSGPPRYDWIDVEAAAAVKIQSTFRRHLALKALEEKGVSTAAMRNKIRSRNARKKNWDSEDVPTMFRFCGIGYLFSDATGEDTYAYDAEHTATRDEKFNAKINKDAKLRKFKMRQKADVGLEEAVEVVDNVDERQY